MTSTRLQRAGRRVPESEEARQARLEERLNSFITRSDEDRIEAREERKSIQTKLNGLQQSVQSATNGIAELARQDLAGRVTKLEQNLNLWRTIMGGGWRVMTVMLGSGIVGAVLTKFLWHTP